MFPEELWNKLLVNIIPTDAFDKKDKPVTLTDDQVRDQEPEGEFD